MHIRHFFLTLVCSGLFSTLYCTDIRIPLTFEEMSSVESHAQKWAQECAISLSSQELQLMGNFLYFAIRLSQFDHWYRAACIDLTSLLQQIFSLASDDTDQIHTQFAEKALQFQTVWRARTSTEQCAFHCRDEIEKATNPAIETLYNQLYQQEQNILKLLIEQKRIPLFTKAESHQKQLAEKQKTTDSTHNLLQSILASQAEHRGQNIELKSVLGQMEALFVGVNQQQNNLLSYLIQITQIQLHQIEIAAISFIVYRFYYKALHPVMSNAPDYHTALFGPNGLLAKEYQFPLPKPNEIFSQ